MNAITGAVHPTSTWNTDRWTHVVQHHARLLRAALSQAEPGLADLTSTAANLHYHLRNRTDLDGDGSPALLRAIIVE